MPKITYSQVLEERPDGGTRVEFRFAKPRPKDRAAFLAMLPMVEGMLEPHRSRRSRRCSRPRRPRPAEGDGVEVPESRGRFASEPVTA